MNAVLETGKALSQPALDRTTEAYVLVRLAQGQFTIDGLAHASLGHRLSCEGDIDDGVYCEWRWDGAGLSVETDRYGLYPVYYYQDETRCAVSPSIPTLLKLLGSQELDYAALSLFFRLGYFIGDDTPFRRIRAMPPGARFIWSDGHCRVEEKRPDSRAVSLSRSAAIDGYVDLFRQAMSRRPPLDGATVIPLSGGRDSRHILLETARHGYALRECLTVSPEVEYSGSDSDIAIALTRRLGVTHTVLAPEALSMEREWANNHQTNFCADEHAWLRPAATRVNSIARTLYDGIGGDVLSAGLFLTKSRLDLFRSGELAELALDLMGGRPSELPFLKAPWRKLMSWDHALERLKLELARHERAPNPVGSYFFWNRTRREIALSPYRLFGRVSQAYAPYLDHHLYDLLAGLDASMFLDHTFHTETINRAFPRFADLPYASKNPQAVPVGRTHRVFAMDVLAHALRRSNPYLKKSYLVSRFLRAIMDPSYLPYVEWLGSRALYMMQLHVCASGEKD